MMLKPDSRQIEQLAKEYDILPISREIFADVVTPITLLRRIAAENGRCFLLESIEGGEKWGRYSFLGYNPVLRVSCKRDLVTIEGEENREIETKKPLEVLREILARHRAPKIAGMPPFTGGFVGYFSYAMIGYAEPVLKLQPGDTKDFDVMLFDKVIAYDHLTQKITVIVNMKTEHVLESYGQAVSEIDMIVHRILDQSPLPRCQIKSKPQFTCNTSREAFCQMVDKAKAYIRKGDIFQAVLSRRFETEYQDDLLAAYRVLRTTNPSPYMVYLKSEDAELISTSPETLVKLQDGHLSTFPVAGSRPRGKTDEEDAALEQELLQDEKELSEHNMLVDLARNDLGKLSTFGSVKVTNYKLIHRYSKIMHITSVVESEISPRFDACDAVEALLPAGTLSGAPKIRACQIIEELEKQPRGIYGGAIGYMDFSGNLDVCIAIRMAVKQGNRVTVQAGGGIVADSVPELEYEESANKAKAVIQAIERACEVDDL